MSAAQMKNWPIITGKDEKSELRSQFGSLCYRIKNDKVQVLIVTSRRSKSWIIPKGWGVPGLTAAQSAETEAWEEAGVRGRVDPRPLGLFSYTKLKDDDDLPCAVIVFGLKVRKIANTYPEKSERRRKWVSRKKAAKLLASAELAELVRNFEPRKNA